MTTFLVLLITALISQTFGYVPLSQGLPEQQWVLPKVDQLGGQTISDQSPEWYPRPEDQCKSIPKSAKTVEISPIVVIDVTYDSFYPCDSTSTVKQISAPPTHANSQVTCNGIVVDKKDRTFYLSYDQPSILGQQKETVTVTNYTRIKSYNNGNINHVECGTIANGRCSGDTIWGIRIAQADDQTGCSKGGSTGNFANYRILEIKGKCQSRCLLGRSIHVYSEPVNNRGLAVRALENEEIIPKPLIN